MYDRKKTRAIIEGSRRIDQMREDSKQFVHTLGALLQKTAERNGRQRTVNVVNAQGAFEWHIDSSKGSLGIGFLDTGELPGIKTIPGAKIPLEQVAKYYDALPYLLAAILELEPEVEAALKPILAAAGYGEE